jgi:hypothetical protein
LFGSGFVGADYEREDGKRERERERGKVGLGGKASGVRAERVGDRGTSRRSGGRWVKVMARVMARVRVRVREGKTERAAHPLESHKKPERRAQLGGGRGGGAWARWAQWVADG